MIGTRHLEHVLALADHGHFGRAASAIGLSQPALSRSLAALERQLGVRLFDRSAGGVEPTVYGRIVIDRARDVSAELGVLEQELSRTRGLDQGSLSVSLGPFPGVLSGQSALAGMVAEHPAIRCRVRTGGPRQVASDVMSGLCDLGMGELSGAEIRDELETRHLASCPVYLCCRKGHPILSLTRASIEDAAAYPWACTRIPGRIRPFMPTGSVRGGHWDEVSGDFVPAIESDLVGYFAELTQGSDVLVVSTLTMVASHLTSGAIAVAPFSEPWIRLNYGFIHRRHRQLPPAAVKFIELARQAEAQIKQREEALRREYVPRWMRSVR